VLEPLIKWFEENQRPLPWRTSYDPYQVWISEVMLQQTQVETALPYYERFIRQLPSIEALAKADEERVLTLWAGLGYYRRAKNLIAAARQIVAKHGGKIPADYEALLGLPGIGQYMAGAILSIAFNEPYPVVDGNVRRVLSRLYGWTEDNPKALWDAAACAVREGEPRLGIGSKGLFVPIAALLIVPASNLMRGIQNRNAGEDPPGKKAAGHGPGAFIRGHSSKGHSVSHEICRRHVGISDVSGTALWIIQENRRMPSHDHASSSGRERG